MKRTMRQDVGKWLKAGETVYGFSLHSYEYHVCKWYLYPLFRSVFKVIEWKYDFYQWLNLKGIMHTKQGNIMHWSDIKKVNK